MTDDFRYSKSQVLYAIQGIDRHLSGNIHDYVLTVEQIAQFKAIREYLKSAHYLYLQ